jgi:hypothetical protein
MELIAAAWTGLEPVRVNRLSTLSNKGQSYCLSFIEIASIATIPRLVAITGRLEPHISTTGTFFQGAMFLHFANHDLCGPASKKRVQSELRQT